MLNLLVDLNIDSYLVPWSSFVSQDYLRKSRSLMYNAFALRCTLECGIQCKTPPWFPPIICDSGLNLGLLATPLLLKKF